MIEKELKIYKKYKWVIDEELFCKISYLNILCVAFPFSSGYYLATAENSMLPIKHFLIGISFLCIYGMLIPYIIFKYFNSKFPKKNLNLIQEIVELEKKLEINEVYFKELYNEIDLILNNNKNVVLTSLPAYQKLLKIPVKLKNEELKAILKAEPETIRNQININNYLIDDVNQYEKNLEKLKNEIDIRNQDLILGNQYD